MQGSVEGVRRRLARPNCQQLFGEFRAQNGEPLSIRLTSIGKTAGDYLADLYFVEGDAQHCRSDETLAAFTVPNSHVIHVCGPRFADRFSLKTHGGEILLIHELLHALGLSENPPSSSQITRAVTVRCGA